MGIRLLDDVGRRGLALDRLGDTLHHRLVGRGGELRDAPTVSLAFAGRDLMPYAPAQLRTEGEVYTGDIEVTWVRRTSACPRAGRLQSKSAGMS